MSTSLSLLNASQAALVIALSSIVSLVANYAKPIIEALPFATPTSKGHDSFIRFFVLLLAEAVVLGGAASHGQLDASSWFGFAAAGVIVASGSIAGYHALNSGASAPDAQSVALSAVQQALALVVPTGGVLPPASLAVPAPLADNAATSSAAFVAPAPDPAAAAEVSA